MRRVRRRLKTTKLDISFKPPYDWQRMIRFYETHPIPGVERVTESTFERVVWIGGSIGFLRVRPNLGRARLEIGIVADKSKIIPEITRRVGRMFDLNCDPFSIARGFAGVPLLARLYKRFPGLRLPGGWDPFETAVGSILGQVVSREQRTNLVGQLVRAYGDPIIHPLSGERAYLFPRPEVLAECDLVEVKTTRSRRETIRNLSSRVLSGAISLAEEQDPKEFRKALLGTKGVGPWSAEYISLRAMGDKDAFPRTDLILKRVLERYPDFDLEKVQPWRSYAAIYLWTAFAQALSKKKRSNSRDTVLQGNDIACGQAQIDLKL